MNNHGQYLYYHFCLQVEPIRRETNKYFLITRKNSYMCCNLQQSINKYTHFLSFKNINNNHQ